MSQPAIHPPTPDVPEAQFADPQERFPGYQVNFWRRPWVQQVLPWATSLSVHIGIIAIALILLASGAFHYLVEKVTQPQVHVPTTALADTSIGGVPNVGNMDDVTSPNAQLDPVEQTQNPLPEGEGDEIEALMDSGSPAAADSITGITGSGALAEALGGGGGEGSTLFGEPGGGGQFMGFDIGRAGDGGAVTRVVFVCDASGSMDGESQFFLMTELRKAIDPLKPNQFFNMVFFGPNDAQLVFPDMVAGSPNNLQETQQRLKDIVFRGESNPIPALQAAFNLKPQLVFFLTDGEFNASVSYAEVVTAVRRLNSDKAVINTIQLRSRNEEAEGTLRTIATENGGDYRFVSLDDF